MENCITFFLHICSLSIIGIGANPMMAGDSSRNSPIDRQFPVLVSLADSPARQAHQNFCAGVLIAAVHVMTAKDCLLDANGEHVKNIAQVTVTIGSSDMTQGGKYTIVLPLMTYDKVAKIDPRLPADAHLHHDVIVFMLNRMVTSPRVDPISLVDSEDAHLNRQRVMIGGWGLAEHGVQSLNLQKKAVTVFTGANSGQPTVPKNNLFTEPNLPAGYLGGPVIVGHKLAGIVTNPNAGHIASANYYKNFIRYFVHSGIPSHYLPSNKRKFNDGSSGEGTTSVQKTQNKSSHPQDPKSTTSK